MKNLAVGKNRKGFKRQDACTRKYMKISLLVFVATA
jgi:hypothetical protein